MCGRFTLKTPPEQLARQFKLTDIPSVAPRYNIAPTDDIAVVRTTEESTERSFALLHWGFVPAWAKDPVVGNRMINARAETAATSPAFRQAFRHRRCLILADGFYEWQRAGKNKQPFYFQLKDGEPFAFAGLWEQWQAADGKQLASCTLLTTTPNAMVRPIHDRMPVMLTPDIYDHWLDPNNQEPSAIQPLLHPFDADAMLTYPVTPLVNNPRNDDPQCIMPLDS
ncbi:MAG: SOS response-associated peptidase [Herpetosiphonaceae bacterium]|nr:SOS response-associated peptidase [Herpetosiphonaceae bacterium]